MRGTAFLPTMPLHRCFMTGDSHESQMPQSFLHYVDYGQLIRRVATIMRSRGHASGAKVQFWVEDLTLAVDTPENDMH